jgi:tetratricopeptide (TPR) repeat protein
VLVYIAIGNLGQGADDLGTVLAIRPDFVEAHIERARLFLATDRYEEGETACSLAIEQYPDCPEAYLIRALARYALGRYERAWQDIHQLERFGTPAPAGFSTALSRASGHDSGT